MATLALNDGKLEDAQSWLNKALRAGAKETTVLHQTILLAMLKKNEAQAHSLLTKATIEYPTDLRYWVLLAEVLLNQNAVQEVEFQVLPAMQKALNTPHHFLVHSVRGFLLRKKGPRDYKDARLELLQALALNTMLPDIWSAVFDVDLALGNQDFIESDAKNKLTVEPDHALANYFMGSILLSRKSLQKSEDFLRRSIEKKPTPPACNDLGENLRQQQRLTEAEAFARQALALQPDFPPALDTLACILLDAQRAAEAVPFAEKANVCSPKTPTYQLTLLRLRIKQNAQAEAIRLSDELMRSKTAIPEELQKELRRMRQTSSSPSATTPPAATHS